MIGLATTLTFCAISFKNSPLRKKVNKKGHSQRSKTSFTHDRTNNGNMSDANIVRNIEHIPYTRVYPLIFGICRECKAFNELIRIRGRFEELHVCEGCINKSYSHCKKVMP